MHEHSEAWPGKTGTNLHSWEEALRLFFLNLIGPSLSEAAAAWPAVRAERPPSLRASWNGRAAEPLFPPLDMSHVLPLGAVIDDDTTRWPVMDLRPGAGANCGCMIMTPANN